MKNIIIALTIILVFLVAGCKVKQAPCDFTEVYIYGVPLHAKRPFQLNEDKLRHGLHSAKLHLTNENDLQKIKNEILNLTYIGFPKNVDYQTKILIELVCSHGHKEKITISDSHTFYKGFTYENNIQMIDYIESMFPYHFEPR